MYYAAAIGYCLFEGLSRGVAQSGSALQWGCRGRRFESSRPDQYYKGAYRAHGIHIILDIIFLTKRVKSF